MSKSSIDLLVEFHTNSSDEDAETTTITNEEDGTKSRQPRKKNQKQFKVFEYLSIPPPRTTQLDLVKKKLVEQYPEEINNVDSIESIIFMPFVDGSITQGRSTSGKVPLRQEEKEDDDDDVDLDLISFESSRESLPLSPSSSSSSSFIKFSRPCRCFSQVNVAQTSKSYRSFNFHSWTAGDPSMEQEILCIVTLSGSTWTMARTFGIISTSPAFVEMGNRMGGTCRVNSSALP
mmetsp:Transcript_31478/g.75951  ORF Transcript_31478/g.75951 Transcript_31478/m.75951 type:complete len:233 (-) Transcript_31478:563-1261(-)